MTRLYILLALFFILNEKTLFSQTRTSTWEGGIGFGTVQYYGELENQLGKFKKLNSGIDLTLKKQLSPYFNISMHYGYNYLEAYSSLGHQYSMFGNINSILSGVSINLLKPDKKITPYINTELGVSLGRTWGNSMDNGGAYYSKSIAALTGSFGIGLKMKLSDNISSFTEINALTLNAQGIDGATKDPNTGDLLLKFRIGITYAFGLKPDSDGDGITDKLDKCPHTPPFIKVDKHGCPLDSDKDGISDYMDKCPDEFGLSTLQGCPDSDMDGIPDYMDLCPAEFGTKENKGCPEIIEEIHENDSPIIDNYTNSLLTSNCTNDKDCDGVTDKYDKCPEIAGDIRNYGCPLTTTTSKWRRDIKVAPIHFVSGATYITDFSKGRLAKLINILNENENLSVWLFGHTDAKGSSEINQIISEKRVKIAVNYLIDNGISPNRIFSIGFGETFPVSFGRTEEDLLLNRRIDFYLFE